MSDSPAQDDDAETDALGSAVRVARIEDSNTDEVSVVLSKDDGFYVGASRPGLRIGSQLFVLSHHPPDGDLRTLIFTIPKRALVDVDENAPMHFASREADLALAGTESLGPRTLQAATGRGLWALGRLDKSRLQAVPESEGAKR